MAEKKKEYDQQAYNKKYAEKNKDHVNYLRSRSAARSFIRNKASEVDLQELESIIALRRKEIN